MSLSIKPGASLRNIQPQIAVALIVAEGVFRDLGFKCMVTSGNDSQHMSGSLHYAGKAVDLRLRDIPEVSHPILVAAMKLALGPEFDVVFEDHDGVTHLHVEFDPKTVTPPGLVKS